MSVTITSRGIPVDTVRPYDGCIAPRADGGFNWIKPFYTAPLINPCEFIVANLEANTYHSCLETGWRPGKSGKYPSQNFGPKHQLRAADGRIFMPASKAGVYYYDPLDELVHDLGRVQDPAGGDIPDSTTYAMVFNETGSLLFGTTVPAAPVNGDHRPCVFTVDPVTLKITFKSRVGSTLRTLNGYGYYAWVCGNWGYTIVGQEFWEIVATNLTTGVSTTLANESVNGWGYFDDVPGKGLTVRLVRNNRIAGETTRRWWLIDGQLVPYTVGQDPPVLRNVTPYSNPVVNMPQIDEMSLPQHIVKWRPAGSTDAWTSNHFGVTYAAPIPIDSLTTLPDGSVFFDVTQYQGFGVIDTDDVIANFGAFSGVTEGDARCVVGGLIYFSGYPNGVLYSYDVTKPWDGLVNGSGNPKFLNYFAPSGTLSQVKRAEALAYGAGPARLYMAGLKDRTGTGGGIGYYDIGTKKFDGHADGLENVYGHIGLAALPNLLVMSGSTVDGGPGPLILFTSNLVELERQFPIAGLSDPGKLFTTSGETHIVVALSVGGGCAYRYDVISRALLGVIDLSGLGVIGVSTQAVDGSILVIIAKAGVSRFVSIDPISLSYTVYGDLPAGLGPVTCIAESPMRGTVLISVGAELFELEAS